MPNGSEPSPGSDEAFGVRFCRLHRCDEAGFERKLFWGCLHRPGVLMALLVTPFAPTAFHSEKVLIKDLWRTRNLAEIDEAIRYYQGLQGRSPPWRIRMSSRRVVRLARKVFSERG